MSEKKKFNTVPFGRYVTNKNDTRMIYLGPQRDKDGNLKGPNIFPITLADGTVIEEGFRLFVNLFDEQFRAEKKISPNFIGTISLDLDAPEFSDEERPAAKSKPKF